MSLTQDRGNHVFQCDNCLSQLDTGTSNFEAARNLLLRAGWLPMRRDNEWQHYCNSCKPERLL